MLGTVKIDIFILAKMTGTTCDQDLYWFGISLYMNGGIREG